MCVIRLFKMHCTNVAYTNSVILLISFSEKAIYNNQFGVVEIVEFLIELMNRSILDHH